MYRVNQNITRLTEIVNNTILGRRQIGGYNQKINNPTKINNEINLFTKKRFKCNCNCNCNEAKEYREACRLRKVNLDLSKAAEKGDLNLAIQCFNRGATVDPYGYNSCLVRAVENGHVEMVKLLIKHGAKFTDISLLARACASGRLKMVQLLIDYGINVQEVNNSGLQTACSRGYVEIVKLLIKHGAPVNLAIHNAHIYGLTELIKILKNNDKNYEIDENDDLYGCLGRLN